MALIAGEQPAPEFLVVSQLRIWLGLMNRSSSGEASGSQSRTGYGRSQGHSTSKAKRGYIEGMAFITLVNWFTTTISYNLSLNKEVCMTDYFSGLGSNSLFQNRSYAVMKKNDVYVAVHDVYNNLFLGAYNEQYQDFLAQGFTPWRTYWAIDSKSAIEMAKEFDNQEIIRLQSEIQNLQSQITQLQQSRKNDIDFNNLDPLTVLGFKSSETPTPEQLKTKKIKFSAALHSDKGGSDFLMKLVNTALNKLK